MVSPEFLDNPSLDVTPEAEALRRQIRELASQYGRLSHAPQPFRPGETPIPASGKTYGSSELESLVAASLDFWLTAGRFNMAFERRLAEYLGVGRVLTTNSGSSANLLALATLTSPSLGNRALVPGDEVISAACGFPTTVNPIFQCGLVPVFVDSHLPTYNLDPEATKAAVTSRTRAIMAAHTLGNPLALDKITALAQKHNLFLIEDCCDALGSTYGGKQVGSFGEFGSLSFYPAHQITTGEGGAVFSPKESYWNLLEAHRDWGRDCYCQPGEENACGKRYGWKLGELPFGYDHKYIFSQLGYNFKMTDLQAAVGLAQLDRLGEFVAARKKNFTYLQNRLASLGDRLLLPEAQERSDPAWFGFPLTLAQDVSRLDFTQHLAKFKIGTRLLLAGNLVRQPYMKDRKFRVSGELKNADRIMNQSLWVGVHPGLSEPMLEYMADRIEEFFQS